MTAINPNSSRPRKKKPINWVPYAFVTPPLLLYLVWIIGPMLTTFYISLTSWDGISDIADAEFVGLKNFNTLFGSLGKPIMSGFEIALRNNALWLITFITIPFVIGLGLAIMLNTGVRGERWFKVGIFVPQVLSLAVIALIWGWVYNPRAGLLNSILSAVGVASENLPGWLGDSDIATYCVIAAAVWRQIGYIMILYVAGLKNVPQTLLDAAEVDGANGWDRFRHVTFPLLAPVTTIVVVISVIDSLRSFDLVNIMTRGTQGTNVLANLMYIQAFNNYRQGLGASTAVVLFALSFVFIVLYLWRVMKDEMEY